MNKMLLKGTWWNYLGKTISNIVVSWNVNRVQLATILVLTHEILTQLDVLCTSMVDSCVKLISFEFLHGG